MIQKLLTSLLFLALLAACSGPTLVFPGGELAGEEQPLDLSTLPPEGGVLALETNPEDPYSVNLNFFVVDGKLYLDPAESREWYVNIKKDARLRIQFAGEDVIHPVLAVPETDPAVIAQFDPTRIVLRLEPRNGP